MADRIFARLTARQLAILGAHGLVLLALYAVLGERLPFALLAVMAIPVCLLGLLWATTSPQGTTWEQLGFAALRVRATYRRWSYQPSQELSVGEEYDSSPSPTASTQGRRHGA